MFDFLPTGSCSGCQKRKEWLMQNWHIGFIVALIAAYLVGVKFPSIGQTALSKVGL